MSDLRWYVVADDYVSGDLETEAVWTLSLDPECPGWETESGSPGYGLPKALAQELADAANKAWREAEQEKGDSAIEELGLPARAYNALKAGGIHTVAELRRESEQTLLRFFPNIGHKSLHDIRLALKAFTEGEGR